MKITKPTFSASVICTDPLNTERDILKLKDLGHKFLHIDIMDGNFVPRFGIFPEICQRIQDIAPDMHQDCHIMCDDVEFTIDQFSDIESITTFTFHIDGNEANSVRIIDKIRKNNKRAGVALNMGSNFESTVQLIKYLDLDFVLFLGIHPGVLDQVSKPTVLASKIIEFKERLSKENIDQNAITIQVDGAVSFETIPALMDAGATFFVGGSSTIYKKPFSVEENSKKIKELMDV
jgi:ribulose-phosphate 3-epimerase